jgi:hypothetical protein
MSQNIFRINPIFFVPIDNQEISKSVEELKNNASFCSEHKRPKNKKKKEIDIEDKYTYDNSSSGKESDEYVNMDDISTKNEENEKNNEKTAKNEEKDIIVFSTSINDRHIKSMSNSSKIYTSEIFKQNWKLKSRRLITKLKRKLIKQYNSLCMNNADNDNNNNYNHNDYNNNYINNDESNYKNIYINNNNNMNNNSNMGNNLADNFFINLQKIGTNININFNQFNNNCQIYNNSLNNNFSNNYNNELEKYKYLLYLANIGC